MISKKQLMILGLNDKEAAVYLASLSLGPATISEISRTAKINRTTGYDVLESLIRSGLAISLGDGKVQKFAAESPEKVLVFLEKKIKREQERFVFAKNILPELLSIYNLKDKPKVKFYEGVDGVKEALEDTLNAKGQILGYAVGADAFEAVGEEYLREYFKKRVDLGIKIRLIAPSDQESLKVISKDKTELRESLVVPSNKFYFSTETNIYNNKILNISWKEKFAVIIESREIADAQRNVFELAWLGAKQFLNYN